jgi:hypothetical protein
MLGQSGHQSKAEQSLGASCITSSKPFSNLSPIELVWAIVKRVVAVPAPTTVDELQQVIKEGWRTISRATIDDLCAGLERRLQICLDVEGQSISKLLGVSREIQAFRRWWTASQNNKLWTADEDALLYRKVRDLGTRWALFEQCFIGRSAAGIKNHWYTAVSKRASDPVGHRGNDGHPSQNATWGPNSRDIPLGVE